MHRSTAGHNPYNLFIFTIVYSKNLPTSYLRTIEHMAMFVVKSIHIQINSQVMDLSIVWCQSDLVSTKESELPVCVKPYHMNRGLQQKWEKIKNVWNYAFPDRR